MLQGFLSAIGEDLNLHFWAHGGHCWGGVTTAHLEEYCCGCSVLLDSHAARSPWLSHAPQVS